MRYPIRVVTLGMPVSFTGFSGTALVIMVAVLAAVQIVNYFRKGTDHTS
jgi:hypothetical protein